MKKVMKFVKGKREEETTVKNVPIESKNVVNEKVDITREDDFISRDKSITKLHKAVWNENSDKLKSIIKTHDIDITDKLDRTALYFAVLKNNPNIVNLLLENSANQNIPDIDGITPFLKSVQFGYKQCAANLLSYGADLKKTDKDSNSCLHFAVLGKQTDMLSFLLEHNADSNVPNVNGEYPLHIAIQLKDKQMVELLLNHNVDINVVNNSGLTPLMLAEQQNSSEIIEMLENYSLKNSKENNLFPDEISHKSSYENVNTPKIDQKHSSKPESDGDTWNDSPLTTPTKKHDKPLTKISKFFNEEIEITEEKSESDVSVKCSENTSPQSGIIPPPCKPLRSLEYLQSGMVMENRPVHLLTLGTVRTRHISMTESDHSKNNTPHRYSYQGDFQAASGDSVQKLPDNFSAADEKGDSVNISAKSKLLSKLECDSTIQSDWGSNESLPLDELSVGGKKEKSATSSTSKNTSNNSNSGSIRDKSTDIFLQKQFSLLEDYEKNREKRCSVSYEMDLLTVKMDKDKDNSDGKLDDIDNLLEDNNRINTQLEKYAGQTDSLASTTKSKSLPRNCEPYNSYHKGSFSLPRTLESGKDPFREMRSCGYFKPRSHFSFSLKMLKGDKKTGFIDKLKSMFNKKSQIHLTEQNENGTWLYKKNDNEYYSSKVDSSASESETFKKGDILPTSKTVNNFTYTKNFEDDSISFSNNEQNKVLEKKILSLNDMSSQSRQASCGLGQTRCSNEFYSEEEPTLKHATKKTGSQPLVDSIFCEDCADFVNQKLNEAEQNITSKESFIILLQEQLEQLKDRNIKSINEAQEIYYKYSLTQQEVLKMKHLCSKYDDEMQKLRLEKSVASDQDETASKLKEEAEKWKKQYEDLMTKITLEGSSFSTATEEKQAGETKTISNEEKWRSIIQNEVATAVNILKENSQVVISSLEKQNKMLEIMVEKLQTDLDGAIGREDQLHKELEAIKEKLAAASAQSEQIKLDFDKNYEDTLKSLKINNDRLKEDLLEMTKLYSELQRDYEGKLKKNEDDTEKLSEISEEYNIVKEEYRSLTRNLSNLSEEIVKAKENALYKNEELRQQIAEMGPSANMKQFINKITESLESIEMTCACKPEGDVSEQVNELSNSITDVEKINKLNSTIEVKIAEINTNKKLSSLQEENKTLKEDMIHKCDNIIAKVKESSDEIEMMSADLKSKNDLIKNQCLQICNLKDIIENEKQKNQLLESEVINVKSEIEKEKPSKTELSEENESLKSQLDASTKKRKSLEEENINIKLSFSQMVKNNEELKKKLQEAIETVHEMKGLVAESQYRMENLEKANQELKETVESLNNAGAADGMKYKEYEEKVNNLVKDNKTLNKQLEKEKDNIVSLQKHIKSLQFYHENEMKANNVRLEEIQVESIAIKNNLQADIDKQSNMNVLLHEKLEAVEEENIHLQNNITDLHQELNILNDKLQNTYILQDSQKYVDALDAVNKENIEMKTAMNVLREILEVKLGEKVNSVHDFLELKADEKPLNTDIEKDLPQKTAESIEKQVATIDSTGDSDKKVASCKENCGIKKLISGKTVDSKEEQVAFNDLSNETVKKKIVSCEDIHDAGARAILVQRVSRIEKKIDEIVEDVSIDAEDIKSISMPNLEDIGNDKIKIPENIVVSAKSDLNSLVRKSSSLDFIIGKGEKLDVKEYCENKWEKHLESIHKLRTELIEILQKIDDIKTPISSTETTSKRYTDKYKQVVSSLQKQIHDLHLKSTEVSNNFPEELKGQMCKTTHIEEELYRLRKELYKQKVERLRDTEVAKINREAEIFTVQQHLKFEYLRSKQKLLKDLAAVQTALQVKTAAENKIKTKCDALIKEVTAKQEARQKKLKDISFLTVQPSSSTVQKIVICDVLNTSRQVCNPQCSGYPEKPIKPHALVINARKKLNATLEKHRLSTESVPESISDEEYKKKYLLQ